MNRREFIAKSSSAALAFYLTSCASKRILDPNVSAAEAARRDLSKMIQGSVMMPGDPGYQTTVTIDNGRVKRSPLLVVAPSSTNDIAKTVKYCRAHGLRLTTKCGGHSAAGYCLNSEGIVLDLSKMNAIRPHDGGELLSVGAGTRWLQVYDHVKDSDRIAIGGGCAGVGVSGFLTGGGFSFLSRSHGLGCDNVRGMEFVSADGDTIHLHDKLTDSNERDLYWALKGAGGGNFGIVSQLDLRLHKRRTPAMMMGSFTFPFERASEILHFYNDWVSTLPHEMAVYGMIRRFSDLSLVLNPFYNGSKSEGMKLLKPLFDLSPAKVEMETLSLPQWESHHGRGTEIGGRSAYMRSVVMAPKSLNAEVVAILGKYMNQAPTPDSFIVWTHTGGKVRDLRDGSNCYAHRDAEFVFELKSIWDSNKPRDRDGNVAWAVKFVDELEAHALGAYVNYIDPLLENWQEKYYRASYQRLLHVKSHWDPKGYFDFQQGIGSSFAPTRTQPLDLSPLDRT